MKLNFVKYQGTGNDFVIVDNRNLHFPKDVSVIQRLTDRKFGIGADGLILIENHHSLDFRMRYFNADGSESLCGNGSRCAVLFANELGMIGEEAEFETSDGVHKARIEGDWVYFQLHDQKGITKNEAGYFMDNGSPHHVTFVEDVEDVEVVQKGKEIRNSEHYQPMGTNVNFVEVSDEHLIKVRTYERGVEAETLSCGTGVTASALVASLHTISSPVSIVTSGGKLEVSFDIGADGEFINVFLAGPAKRVFDGNIDI